MAIVCKSLTDELHELTWWAYSLSPSFQVILNEKWISFFKFWSYFFWESITEGTFVCYRLVTDKLLDSECAWHLPITSSFKISRRPWWKHSLGGFRMRLHKPIGDARVAKSIYYAVCEYRGKLSLILGHCLKAFEAVLIGCDWRS